MLTLGLTGGIAAGKSTVARALVARGAAHVDADRVAHALTGPGGVATEEVLARFGDGVRAPNGGVDRRALADRVFSSREAREALEALLHPLIREAIEERRRELAASDGTRVLVVEAALLVEAGRARAYDLLLVVEAPLEAKIERLARTRRLTEREALGRLDAQLAAGRKLLLADICIWNDGDEAALAARCEEAWEHVDAGARAARTRPGGDAPPSAEPGRTR